MSQSKNGNGALKRGRVRKWSRRQRKGLVVDVDGRKITIFADDAVRVHLRDGDPCFGGEHYQGPPRFLRNDTPVVFVTGRNGRSDRALVWGVLPRKKRDERRPGRRQLPPHLLRA